MSRNFTNPEQEDIDKIINLLNEIRDILVQFIEGDLRRLAHPDFASNWASDVDSKIKPIIRSRINDAIGYINANRHDPSFRDALRNIGFFRPEVDTKISAFDKIKRIWSYFKGGAKKIARRVAHVLFDEIDSILNSLAKVIPVLEGVIEIKEHIQNAVSAADALE